MTVEHNILTGDQLHEPKGVSGASSGTYYMSDGAASGAWTNVHALTEDTTISSVSSVEITGLGDYTHLAIEVDELAYSAAESMSIVLGDASSYLTTNGYSGWYRTGSTEINVISSDRATIHADNTTTGTYYLNGILYVTNFNRNLPSTIEGSTGSSSSAGISGTTYPGFHLYYTLESRDYDRIKIQISSGTFSGDAIRVFGLKGTAG